MAGVVSGGGGSNFQIVASAGWTVQFYGAQLEVGSVMTAFIRTGVAALTVFDSLKRSTLIEPQRTNLLTFSEDLTNAVWTQSGVTVAAGGLTPEGATGQTVTETATNVAHLLSRTPGSHTAAQSQAFSWTLKPNTRSIVYLQTTTTGANILRTWVDLSNGRILSTTGSGATHDISCIVNPVSGWAELRCVVGLAAGIAVSTTALGLATDDQVVTYLGDGASGIYAGGAQHEANALSCSSYIPTTSAGVTRAVESLQHFYNAQPQLQTMYTRGAMTRTLQDNSGNMMAVGGGTAYWIMRFYNAYAACLVVDAQNGAPTTIASGEFEPMGVTHEGRAWFDAIPVGVFNITTTINERGESGAAVSTTRQWPGQWYNVTTESMFVGSSDASSGAGVAVFRLAVIEGANVSLASLRALVPASW